MKMCAQYLIFSLIFSILLTNFAETQSVRGPREYGEALPASRSEIVPKIPNINANASAIPSLLKTRQSEEDVWEPLACSECLNDRYLEHYRQRDCKPVNIQLPCKKPCPKYFDCPKKQAEVAVNGCEYKGKVYKIGETIEHDNPCKQACYCDQSRDQTNISKPEIRCALVDCFNSFRAPTPNCFAVYEEGRCCPREKCLTSEQVGQERQCLYNGQQYHLGQTIYPKEDPCLECKCDENWNQTNPVKSSGCKTVKCDLQTNFDFKAGCIPIYHEGVCCPIEYFCTPPEEEQCKFNGKSYLIGEQLLINRERTECTCRIPPDFTCIQKIVETFEIPLIKLNETKDYIKDFQTLPKIIITNSSEVPFANIAPLNQDSKCPPLVPGGLACAGVNCTTIFDINGCQACKCQKPCPQIKCREGCTIFATTPGVCPKCKCD